MADNRTDNEKKLDNINARANWMFEKLVTQIREAVLWTQFDIAGDLKGKTSIGNEMRWIASNFRTIRASNDAQTKSLIAALAAVAKGEPFDEAKLLAGVQAAAEAGVRAAVDSIQKTETTTVTMKEGSE